jgi:hypothetical protein
VEDQGLMTERETNCWSLKAEQGVDQSNVF